MILRWDMLKLSGVHGTVGRATQQSDLLCVHFSPSITRRASVHAVFVSVFVWVWCNVLQEAELTNQLKAALAQTAAKLQQEAAQLEREVKAMPRAPRFRRAVN